MDLVNRTEETSARPRPMGRMERLIRMLLMGAALTASLSAADFSLGIGGSVASKSLQMKGAMLVARPENCADPAKARIEATAEGLVNGARKTVRLRLAALETPGGVAVFREWPTEGVWVVNLHGYCESAQAGAVVPIGPKGFIRESSKFFPRAATEAEIEAVLKSFAGQSNNK